MLLPLLLSALAAQAPQDAPAPVKFHEVNLQAESKPASKPARKKIYDEAADARAEIAKAAVKAKKNGRRVLVQWGANWCGWCHLLHDVLKSDKNLAGEMLYEYDLVLVDVGRFDKNVDLAKELGATGMSKGIPYLTILDGDGKPLANEETEQFEVKDKSKQAHDPQVLLTFLKKHENRLPGAEAVLAEGQARAKEAGKNLFLHFGAPWCGWCHRLEDWMAKPEVAAILEKDYIDVKIDQDRNPGGKELLTRLSEGKSGGIPWFLFVGPDGHGIVNSNLPKGTIGFPATPEEIAHFVAMLKMARIHLTDGDIAKLEASLVAESKRK
jgi:thiol-disulfide isomerase/thioredoxin